MEREKREREGRRGRRRRGRRRRERREVERERKRGRREKNKGVMCVLMQCSHLGNVLFSQAHVILWSRLVMY